MVRSWLSLLALLLVVAGLAAWLFYNPGGREEKAYPVSALKPSEVTRLKLGRGITAPGKPPAMAEIVMEKRDGEWRLTAPFAARADAITIERLLAVLEAKTTVRYPATDLARYGLDAPLAVLTANDQAIAYGAINPTTREQYVLAGNQVLVVPVSYAAALPRSIDALLTKSLFAAGEKAPVRFDLPDFTVALEEGTWAVAPIASEAGADERNAWVDAWKNASALTVVLHTSPSPAESVRVTLKDGRSITLGIAQRTPDVVLVREDERVAYHFFAETGRRLLAPPGAAGGERVNK